MSIKIDCNELIVKNTNLLQIYKDGFSQSVLDDLSKNGWKINLLPPDYEDIFSDEYKASVNKEQIIRYKSSVHTKFYYQMVKTIIALDKELYTLFEKSLLIEQLNKLTKLFFDVLESECDIYWHQEVETITRAEFEGYWYDGLTKPLPKEFTKEYVLKIINNISPPAANEEQQGDYMKKTWFIVGLKFADGTVYNCKEIKKGGFTGEKFAELVFKKEIEKAEKENLPKEYFKMLVGKTRQQIGDTLNFIEGDFKYDKGKNLFKKNEESEERWLKIIKHCKADISQYFLDDFIRVYGYDPTK